MIVLADRQFVTAFCTASLQYFATVSSLHAIAKTVYTKAAVDSRLVGPFGHSTSSQKRINNTANLNYTAVNLSGQRFLTVKFQ